ncbi:hypothetical protein BDFG_06861 [Blastomyces dermatitidis ATCC 26199]|nr:hypothetical protein BDFG_06861 [Blastomyces dermatitidis ATCC 26199]
MYVQLDVKHFSLAMCGSDEWPPESPNIQLHRPCLSG